MAGNYQLGELGQVLTSNVNSNTISLGASLSIGNSSVNATTVSTNNLSITGQIIINGNSGLSTYVLTSNGSSNAYWALPTPTINAAATVAFTNATASTSANSGAIITAGGLGVNGNIYTAGRVGFSNATNVSVVYTYYNQTLGTLDTVFG